MSLRALGLRIRACAPDRKNPIGTEGGRAIGAALRCSKSLAKLYLGTPDSARWIAECDIGPEGGAAIGAALADNVALQELDLSIPDK